MEIMTTKQFTDMCQRAYEGVEGRDIYPFKKRLQEELDVIDRMGIGMPFLIVERIVKAVKTVCYPYVGGAWTASLVAYGLGVVELNPLSTKTPYQRLFHEKKLHIPKLQISVPKGYRESAYQAVEEQDRTFVEITEDKDLAFMTCKQAAQNTDVFADSKVLVSAAKRYYRKNKEKLFPIPSFLQNTTEFAEYLIRDKRRVRLGYDLDMLYYENLLKTFTEKYELSIIEADIAIKAFAIHAPERETIEEELIGICNCKGYSRMELHEFLCKLTKAGSYSVLFSAYKGFAEYLYTMEKVCFLSNEGVKKV